MSRWEPSDEYSEQGLSYDGGIAEAEAEFDRHMAVFAPGRLRHKVRLIGQGSHAICGMFRIQQNFI